MHEVKGQGHIVDPVSNQCTSFSIQVNRTNHSWDMGNRMFDFEKIHPIFFKFTITQKSFQQSSSKI